jgi:pimeloyl-ACP methyl ester carboxylesterase
MPFFTAPHTIMYYDILPVNITPVASSPAILLVHGFASTAENDFAPHMPLLRQRYTLIAPHLHGYGRSSPRDSYPSSYYRDDVADLIALLDALQLPAVYVLGFSDGAIVSLLLAALHPQRVKALAVLGAQATVSAQDVAAIRHWLLETPMSPQWQAELARLHGEPYWRRLPAMYVQGQEALVASGGVLITDEELARITCPTLIMHGTRDRIVPVTYAYALHERIAGSYLHLFETGHPAHLRFAQTFTEIVLQFFHNPTVPIVNTDQP